MKKYLAIAAAFAALMYWGTQAFSQDAEDAPVSSCIQAKVMIPTLEDAGIKVTEVDKTIVDALVAKKGLPPKTVEGFKLYREGMGGRGQVFSVNPDGCVGYVSPVITDEQLDKFLDVVRA